MSPVIRRSSFVLLTILAFSFATVSASDPAAEVTKLVAQLKDSNEATRLKAAKELGKLKEHAKPAIEALRKVAESDPDEDVRAVAKRAVAAIRESLVETDKEKDKELVAPLLKGLESKKASERVAALEELTKLGEKARPATSAISKALLDASPTVREAAAGCLEKVDPTLHKPLISIMLDKNEFERAGAVAQLGKLGARAKGAVPVLKSYYSANNARFKREARANWIDIRTLEAMVEIVPDDAFVSSEVLHLVSSAGIFRSQGLKMLEEVDVPKKKKVEALIAALGDANLRVTVIEQLANYGADAKPALPTLMKLKFDSTAAVREAATKAIETITAE